MGKIREGEAGRFWSAGDRRQSGALRPKLQQWDATVVEVGTGGNAGKVKVLLPGEVTPTTDLPWAPVHGEMPAVSDQVLAITDAASRRVVNAQPAPAPPTLADLGIKTARKSADQNFASLTQTNVTDMAIPVGASEVWQFEFHVFYKATTGADLRLAVTFPTSPTGTIYAGLGLATTITTQGGNSLVLQNISEASGITQVGGAGTTLPLYACMQGILRNGPNAGDIQLTAAQNTLDAANPSVVTLNTHYIAHKLA